MKGWEAIKKEMSLESDESLWEGNDLNTDVSDRVKSEGSMAAHGDSAVISVICSQESLCIGA